MYINQPGPRGILLSIFPLLHFQLSRQPFLTGEQFKLADTAGLSWMYRSVRHAAAYAWHLPRVRAQSSLQSTGAGRVQTEAGIQPAVAPI